MAASLPKQDNTPISPDDGPEYLAHADHLAGRIAEDLTLEDLLRGIVQKAGLSSRHAQETRETGEPILSVDIDGVHYSVVCSPSAQGHHLSPREQEIARLVAEGLPNKCISTVLEISTWTVATHLRRIFAKLGVSSRAAMVARVLEERFKV